MTKNKQYIAAGIIAAISVFCYIAGQTVVVSQFNQLSFSMLVRVFENAVYKLPFVIACFFFVSKPVGRILTAISFGYMVLGQVVTVFNGVNLPYILESVLLTVGSVFLIVGSFKKMRALDIFAAVMFAVSIALDVLEYAELLRHGVNIEIIAVFYLLFALERVLFFLSAVVFLTARCKEPAVLQKNEIQRAEALLVDLKRLFDEGEISQEDYTQRKQNIIKTMLSTK